MKSMKILLVDDDAFLRDMYATKFTENGDEVATAQNGAEALRLVENDGPFDVVVLDMVMPGISGTELIAEVQALGGKKNKCIVLSNQGEEEDIQGANEAGAIGYIIKAESIPSEVVEKVHKLLKK